MAELLFIYLFEDLNPDVRHIALGGGTISLCGRRVDGPLWQRQNPPFVLTRARFAKLDSDPDHVCAVCVRRAGRLVDLP